MRYVHSSFMLHLGNQSVLQAQHTSVGLASCHSRYMSPRLPCWTVHFSPGGDTPLPSFWMYLSRICTLETEGSQFFHFCSTSIVSLEIGKEAPISPVEKQLRDVGDVRAKAVPPHPPRDVGPNPSHPFESILSVIISTYRKTGRI